MLDRLYSNKKSKIHEINVETKILYTFIYVISLTLIKNIVTLSISCLALLLLLRMSKLKIIQIYHFIKTIIAPIVSIGIMYKFVLDRSNFEILRTISVLLFSTTSISCFVMTTKVTDIAKGIEAIIPFKKIIPAHELSLMFTISLRFLPLFINEYKRIKKAKICRGIYIEDMNVKGRIKHVFGYFLPMFILSLERAYNLSIAMETKGYRRGIKYEKRKLSREDYMIFIFIIIYIVIIILGGRI